MISLRFKPLLFLFPGSSRHWCRRQRFTPSAFTLQRNMAIDYFAGVPAEEMDTYRPGGYHPVHLGDRFKNGRYQIVQKLGFGSFSTVWLVRDLTNNRNAAIKIVLAEKSTELSHELRVLQHLDKSRRDHPGREHVLHLLDHFYHDGPNGRHLCVVLDVLGPKITTVIERSKHNRIGGQLARHVSRQLLLAVTYLHSSGVAHGDIHLGNILFRSPELETMDPQKVSEKFGPPSIGKVTRRDGQPRDEGIPEYLVEPMEYKIENLKNLRDILLIDFGESFFHRQPPKEIMTPLSFHPPELVFRHNMTKAVDLWNLGCTTFELVTGRSLFEAGIYDRELVPQFKKILGNMPDQWIPDALESGVLEETPNDKDAEDFLPLEEELVRCYQDGHKKEDLELNNEDVENLGKSLRKILVIEPEKRVEAEELLNDPWFSQTAQVTESEKQKGTVKLNETAKHAEREE